MKDLLSSPTVAFVALSLALCASGCFTAGMGSWFLAVVNWLGAFVVLGVCTLDLLSENGNWSQFGVVFIVSIGEVGLLCVYVSRLISGTRKSNGT